MKVKMLYLITAIAIYLVAAPLVAEAQSSKEIIDRLTQLEIRLARVEEGQKGLEIGMARLEAGQEGLNKRIGDVNERIDDLRGLLYIVLGGIITLIGAILSLMGFVIWDRRTTISPVVKQARKLTEDREAVWKVLKEYARKEPQFAEVLRTAGIL